MTESKMPWVKLYTETLDDVKVGRLTDSQKWRFVSLVLLAGECDAAGALVTGDSPMTPNDIAWRLRCDAQTLVTDLQKLTEVGLILVENDTVIVTKFAERQGPTQEEKRKQWRDRQNKRRERAIKPVVTQESRVTPARVTLLDIEEEEDKDKEEEGEEEIPNDSQPTPFRLVSAAVVEFAGLPENTGGTPKWTENIRELVKLGATPELVEQAVKILRNSNKKYRIVSPMSLYNTIAGLISEKNGIQPSGNGKPDTRQAEIDAALKEVFGE